MHIHSFFNTPKREDITTAYMVRPKQCFIFGKMIMWASWDFCPSESVTVSQNGACSFISCKNQDQFLILEQLQETFVYSACCDQIKASLSG